MDRNKIFLFLLRAGLAFVFAYAAIASLITPVNWIGWFPIVLRNLVPSNILLISFSIFEIILAIWILSGKWLFYSSLISAAAMAGIIIFNINQMDIVFRDVAIVFTALGLAVYSYNGFPKK